MPKWLHDKLARAGKKKGLSGRKLQAYIYSVLSKHKFNSRKSTARGRRLATP